MYLNFDDQELLQKQIEELKPTNGVCIFIDFCGSTAIKNENLKKWIYLIGNSITIYTGGELLFLKNIVKLIGDEIMIFIPDDEISKSPAIYTIILDKLYNCLSPNPEEVEEITLKAKAAIHYCTDTFNISFSKIADDYYGNGVDLTARLMKETSERKIVMSEIFYEKIKLEDFYASDKISEKQIKEFKGIKEWTEYRIITVE